jgi:hypothetical protein
LVDCGEALDFETRRPTFTGGAIVQVGKLKRTGRSATIERPHCERAFVTKRGRSDRKRKEAEIEELRRAVEEDRALREEEERLRIEEYGISTLLNRVRIGKYFVTLKQETEGGRRHDYGRPILYMPGDERTPGGVGVDVVPMSFGDDVEEIEEQIEDQDEECQTEPSDEEPETKNEEEDLRDAEQVLKDYEEIQK